MQRLYSVSERISERIQSMYNSLRTFCEEIVQWRRPMVSSFYLLSTNAAFWGTVFYLEHDQQFLALVGIASVLFIASILSPAIIATGEIVPNAKRTYKKWFDQDGNLVERGSFVSTILMPIGMVAFVLESFFLPMVTFTSSLLVQRPASIMIMTGSSIAAHYIQLEQHEKACWTAYLTVLSALLVPPWRYNGVTDHIVNTLRSITTATCHWLRANIVSPIWRFLRRVFSIVRYCVCGYWIPPLVKSITDFCQRIWSAIRRNILDPIGRFLSYLKRQFIYWACGHWIPPLIDYLKEKKRRVTDWIYGRIIEPIVAVYDRIKRFCIYWFGGYWIPPFCEYCVAKKNELKLAFRNYVIEPIIAFFSDFKNNMKYILFGYWIPPFTAWIRRRIIDPVVRGLVKIYETAEYIVRGRWIPGLVAYLKRKALDARLYIQDRLGRLRAYVIQCAIRAKDYCKDLAIRTAIYVKSNIIIPFVQWVKITRTRVKLWLINNVLHPAWEGTKEQWKRFKFYIKHHVLYPALRRVAYLVLSGLIYAWNNAMVPALAVLSEYGGRGKEYALINWVEPGMDWLARNLPEKSPFVDDSDTELKDFLPSEEEEDENTVGISDESEVEEISFGALPTTSASPSGTVTSPPQVFRLKFPIRPFVSPDVGTSSEEEDEFSTGLSFPAVEHADSDEEEEKNMVPRRSSTSSSTSSTTRQRIVKSRKRLSVADDARSSTSRTPSPGNMNTGAEPTKEATAVVNNPIQRTPVTHDHQVASEFDPDFEMIDHNEVDD